MFKIKNLEMEDYPGLSRRAQTNHMSHSRWRGFPFDGQREIGPQKKDQKDAATMALKTEERRHRRWMWRKL